MKTLHMFLAAATLACLVMAGGSAHAQQAQAAADDGVVGTIVEVEGSATVTQESGGSFAAAPDAQLHMNDVVATGAGARVFVLFIDNTELTLAENSKVKIDDYVYDADSQQENKARYSLLQGAMEYVSGLIGHRPNPDVSVTTNVGTIGIRGTDFWAGDMDNDFNVAVNEGQVSLKTDAGEEVVNKGEGTSVHDRHMRPMKAKRLDAKRFQRFAQTVHLKRGQLVRQRIGAMQERQKTLRARYQNYMKSHRKGGMWQRGKENREGMQQQWQEKREERRQDMRQNLRKRMRRGAETPYDGQERFDQ